MSATLEIPPPPAVGDSRAAAPPLAKRARRTLAPGAESELPISLKRACPMAQGARALTADWRVDAMPPTRWIGYQRITMSYAGLGHSEKAAAGEQQPPGNDPDLLATASHEIRTPMYGLLGMIDMTLDTELNEIQRHYMQLARASAASLATLVNDLLDLSKLQSGNLTAINTRCNLHRLLEESLGIFSIRAASREIALRLSCPVDLPQFIEIDATRLLQVLSNLVGNAIKFTSRGQVIVGVSMGQFDEREHLRVAVQDTGPGMGPSDLKRIFQPFVQFHGPASGAIPNTGLGLTITQGIIKAMGGRVIVTSELGVGSCFEVLLPAQAFTAAEDELPVLNATVGLNIRDRVERDQYAQWLSAMGCRCVSADHDDHANVIVSDDTPWGSDRNISAPAVWFVPPIHSDLSRSQDRQPGETRHASVHKPVAPWLLRQALHEVLSGEQAREIGKPENSEWSKLAGATILLVDDDSVSALVSKSMLEVIDAQVTVTSGASEAMKAFMTREFDVILSDLRLPSIDGYALAQWIRQMEQARSFKRTILIALSASTTPVERQRCFDAGMNDFVAKPVMREHLYAVLLRHTQKPDCEASIRHAASALFLIPQLA